MALKPKPVAGAPPWTYALSAIVGAAALVWGIVSYFVPKTEPTKTPVVAATEPAVTQSVIANGGTAVNATGDAQVAVGADPAFAATRIAASVPTPSASQSAQATSGGVAVNAADAARVSVKQGAPR